MFPVIVTVNTWSSTFFFLCCIIINCQNTQFPWKIVVSKYGSMSLSLFIVTITTCNRILFFLYCIVALYSSSLSGGGLPASLSRQSLPCLGPRGKKVDIHVENNFLPILIGFASLLHLVRPGLSCSPSLVVSSLNS